MLSRNAKRRTPPIVCASSTAECTRLRHSLLGAVYPGRTAVMVNRLFDTGTHTLATPVRCRDEHANPFAHPDPRQGHDTLERVHVGGVDADRGARRAARTRRASA